MKSKIGMIQYIANWQSNEWLDFDPLPLSLSRFMWPQLESLTQVKIVHLLKWKKKKKVWFLPIQQLANKSGKVFHGSRLLNSYVLQSLFAFHHNFFKGQSQILIFITHFCRIDNYYSLIHHSFLLYYSFNIS